jgi:hypothetical protein
MNSKIFKLLTVYSLISTIMAFHANSVSAIWDELGKFTNNNKTPRHIKRGAAESLAAQTQSTTGNPIDVESKKEDSKHSHIYNIDLNTIRSEYHVEDAIRSLCIYPKWCQTVTSFYVSPLNTFSCSDENLFVHLDVQTFDVKDSKTFNEPIIKKSVAYLPPKGAMQPTKKTSADCPYFRV